MNSELLSSAEQQVVPWFDSDRRLRRLGYWLTAVLVFGCGVWASFAPIDTGALAPGIVQVEGKRKSVQHLEGGIVAAIMVSNGDSVSKDDPLLSVDVTQANSELLILAGRRIDLQGKLDRLVAERDDMDSLRFSEGLRVLGEDDDRAATAMASESTLFTARRADRDGEVQLLLQQQAQLSEQAAGFEAILASSNTLLSSLDTEIADLAELLRDGYVDKQRLRELERSRSRVLGEIAETKSKIASANVAIAESQLQIVQLNKRFKSEVVDELKQIQTALYDVTQQFNTVLDRVERAIIRSPADGFVLNTSTTTVGAVISAGEELMEIVPHDKALIIEARVSPFDIDRVQTGQSAEVRFAVFKDAYLVTGELTKLSADRLIDSSTNTPYFAAEVAIEQGDFERFYNGARLVPGMPAEVLIKTGERTFIDYILSPLKRTFSTSLLED